MDLCGPSSRLILSLFLLLIACINTNAFVPTSRISNEHFAVKECSPTPKAKSFSTPPPFQQRLQVSQDDNDNNDNKETTNIDYGEIFKYTIATTLQFTILTTLFEIIDQLILLPSFPSILLTTTSSNEMILQPIASGLLFAFLSLRSRIASVLDNSRPTTLDVDSSKNTDDASSSTFDRKLPSWAPPGIAFPFIWIIITILRAVSSTMIYTTTTHKLRSIPLLALLLHLCIGDTWNTITNVEKRLGVSTSFVSLVWLSVWNVILQYRSLNEMAGWVLMPSGLWISIATVLTVEIWKLNVSDEDGKREELWPVEGDGKSSGWKWSNMGDLRARTIRGGK